MVVRAHNLGELRVGELQRRPASGTSASTAASTATRRHHALKLDAKAGSRGRLRASKQNRPAVSHIAYDLYVQKESAQCEHDRRKAGAPSDMTRTKEAPICTHTTAVVPYSCSRKEMNVVSTVVAVRPRS